MSSKVDIITTGRTDLTEYAAEYGYLRGTRLDDEPRYRQENIKVDFLDLHWEDPDFEGLLEAAAYHDPKYIIAGDYARDNDNISAINDRADQLRGLADNVIVVPKSPGQIENVPEWCIVGYSAPSAYEGTDIPLRAYRDTPHDIHILGGTPHQQHRLLGQLWLHNVCSMDCNSHHKAATIGAKAWHPSVPHWRQVDDGEDAVERAYRTSIRNLHREHDRRGIKP